MLYRHSDTGHWVIDARWSAAHHLRQRLTAYSNVTLNPLGAGPMPLTCGNVTGRLLL